MSWNYSRRTIQFLQPLAYCAMVFGIMPCYSFKRRKLTCEAFFIFYNVTLFLLLISSTCVIYMDSQLKYMTTHHVLFFLDKTKITSRMLISFLLLWQNIFKRDRWRQLFHRLSRLESHNNLNTKGDVVLSIFLNPYLVISLNILVCLIIMIVIEINLFINSRHFISKCYLSCGIWHISSNLIFFNLLWNIISCVKLKYKDINEILIGSNHNLHNTMNQIESVERFYKIMQDIVDTINDMFGWIIFFFLSLKTTVILQFISSPLAPNVGNTPNHPWIEMVLWGLHGLLQIIVFIFCVDLATREPHKLLKWCISFQRTLPVTSREYERVGIFKERIRETLPKFTAAGFFQITRTTILSILSVITTYFIVVVQFYSASKA